MFGKQTNKRSWWFWFLCFFIALVLLFGWTGYRWIRQFTPEKLLNTPFVREYVYSLVGQENAGLLERFSVLLGFPEPYTYLVLFQNNTELRPGGGFVGSYGVIRLHNGNVSIVDVDGTENLDRQAPKEWKETPPQVLARELGVDRWYFRDSNWSPDFPVNAERALSFYKKEGGVAADEVDAVLAVDTAVLERLLAVTGPFTVEGLNFTSENIVEKLEYEVEYGYKERGISADQRKEILQSFLAELLRHVTSDFFSNSKSYTTVLSDLIKEKHIQLYAVDADIQQSLASVGIDGGSEETKGDYLLWTDANLAALKTDHAIRRDLSYALQRSAAGQWEAVATMHYRHEGSFDWRTTRYRTYARVFVPQGAQLREVFVSVKDGVSTPVDLSQVETGDEGGKTWFGTLFIIEPGQQKQLSFRYTLPHSVAEQAQSGLYTLFVQKQIGTEAHGLTLDLDFDRTIKTATPPEAQEYWYDARYHNITDLKYDRAFSIELTAPPL